MSQISFLNTLRAIACLLVVFCHLVGRSEPGWFVRPYIDAYVVSPLNIMWEFGWIGVALFFMISGFIIAHIAQVEDRKTFVIKRIFRIYPPFLAALGVATLAAWQWMPLSNWLLEASLLGSNFTLLRPSYTLVMELAFYTLAAAMLPWFRHRPILATVAIALFPFVISLAKAYLPIPDRLVGYSSFIGIFAVGMACYYGWTGRIKLLTVVGLCLLSWWALLQTLGPQAPETNFALNSLYAFVIFLAALWVNAKGGSPMGYIAKRSYSIYLLHVPIGVTAIAMLEPQIGYSAALVLALGMVAIAAELSYTFVEQPTQRWARKLLASRDREAHPAKAAALP